MATGIPQTISVAVRVRPLIASEKARGCTDILKVFADINQISISPSDKSFSFNHVFEPTTSHDIFYSKCIQPIIKNLFEGYNCTILAYGQTGSGKTYTMGTTYSMGEHEMGVIPRAVNDLYTFVNDNFSYDFVIKVSFMELYKEVLYDLLNDKDRIDSILDIREDNKGIFIPNLTEITVGSAAEILKLLSKGSSGRATGKTNMNAQSSRSHAIFTISIAMIDKKNLSICKSSKFHLVDLAGSERASKTGATGETFDEGVNINKGLLALGNVISALGDDKQKALGFISYRNSSLTRLLKDSLGGNSITMMIACVSPADYNMDETLSTLRYADRARKIKNKPVVNQDPHVAETNRMQKVIEQLTLELAGHGGPSMPPFEVEQLKQENKELCGKIGKLSCQLSNVISSSTLLQEHLLLVQNTNERIRDTFMHEYNVTLADLKQHIEADSMDGIKAGFDKLISFQKHINDIDAEHNKSETEIQTQKQFLISPHSMICSDTTVGELEQQQRHAANQIHMHEELEGVTRKLALKEYLVRQVAIDAGIIVDMQAKAEDEAKITALEHERDQLILQLEKAKTAKINGISAEQRKRMQELEIRINELKKRVQEQSRRLSMKTRNEGRIVQLNEEIRVMKQTKVQLIRNMKVEAEAYRKDKLRREQEMTKLRDQDRKRQNQIVRMESLHNRQTNVLKRQMEEAAAVNKRLKASLALRKNVHDSKSNIGKIERLTHWIKNEVDVIINSTQARSTLDSLMDSRALLQRQLDNLENSASENIIKQLEENINLRSLQIKDIQQKLIDSDDSKGKFNWDYVQSMAEAKHAIKYLFETFPDAIKDVLQRANEVNINSNNAELEGKIVDYEEEIGKLKNELQVVVDNAMDANKDVKEIRPVLNNTVTIASAATDDETVHTPVSKMKNEKIENNHIFKSPHLFNDSPIITDDETKDPDWRNTPLGKRINRLQRTTIAGVKKRINHGGCTCKSNCNTRCGCVKGENSCNDSCRCRSSCANRLQENDDENDVQAENARSDIEKIDNTSISHNKKRKILPLQEY